MSNERVSLKDIPVHHRARVQMLNTENIPQDLCLRLMELGFRPHTEVCVEQKVSNGGRVISIGHIRYALDKETLSEIYVLPLDSATVETEVPSEEEKVMSAMGASYEY